MPETKHLPTQLQQYVFISRYARWIEEEGRRETWEETVDRYCQFFKQHYPDTFPIEYINHSIVNQHVMPSMRAFMTAGPALDRDHVAGYNPVRGDTRVVTRELGNVPIDSLAGVGATVLNSEGRWASATFRSYGVQALQRVHLRRNSNSQFSVDCTKNHRWVLSTGDVVPTERLRVGDHINMVTAPKPETDADYVLGVRHGVVYGDGTAARSYGRVKGYMVRLCGAKGGALLPYFEELPRTYPPSAGGDPVVMLYDSFAATHALKELPSNGETEAYLLGFVRGWLAADGSVTKSGHISLCCTGDAADWLQDHVERLGFSTSKVRQQSGSTNYGVRTRDSFIVSFSRSGFVADDFLRPEHRDNFTPLQSRFVVTSVEDLNENAEVFCAEVPDTNTFVLENGILTGNCSYLPIDHVRAFDEILYILMCGTGVGFSVERQSIKKLPEIAEDIHECDTVITVADSKVGWATAFRTLIGMLYNGQIPSWDVSKVRPAGAKLKTFGGRASGPGPLVSLFKFAVALFKKAAGRRLTSIECHDLVCKIADIVVVGGVRRSALISLSNLSDDRMRVAKSGQWWEIDPQRALANNSAAYTEKPDMELFMEEWVSLVKSKSGERGIFNRVAAQKKAAENGRRDSAHEYGTNPCLHPDSMIETVNGRMRIADIKEPTIVYTMLADGSLSTRPASASWVSKRNAETLVVTISSGKEVRCTPDHKIFIEGRGWVEARDIRIGDRVSHLVRNRRGAAYSGVKLTTQHKRDFKMEHHLVWEGVNGPIPDGYDIHHIDNDTYNNAIDNLECLSHADHARLTALEQFNDHQVVDVSTGRFVTHPDSRGGAKTITPMPAELKSNLHQYATVVSIREGERTDVYDMTVEGTHNFIADFVVVHNCGEIILRPNGFCNLTEVVVRADDSLEVLKEKVTAAVIMGTFQSTLTDFRYLRPIWKRNAEEERLLGVSLTGIMDHPVLSGARQREHIYPGIGQSELETWLTALKEHAIEVNKIWAERLGISQSAAITTVKPSGTVSQLVDAASGIHPRYAPYYIRTVRASKMDPLAQFMTEAGFPVEDCALKGDTTSIFSFPVKAPAHAVMRNDMTALQQLEHYLVFKRHWCEHNPSITVYVRDHEWLAVGDWVYNHFDDIGGVSFLPHSDHTYVQAPYQECTEAQYNAMASVMPATDWAGLQNYEREDTTVGTKTYACTGNSCELL